MNRNQFLKLSALVAMGVGAAAPAAAKEVRAGTELDAIYNNMLAKGHGFTKPGVSESAPVAVIVTDSQCPWCSKLFNAALPLLDQVKIIWYPVAVLRDASVTQSAAILGAKDPWALFLEHEAHFKDPDHRGIKTDGLKIEQKFRDQVWENSKIFRRAGGTVVPLGVFKTKEGQYKPILSGTSTNGLKEIFGL